MSIIWNTGPAAMRARHNLRLNKNKKIKRTPGPKLQAPSLKKDIIERYNKRMKDKTTVKKEYQADGTKRQYVLDKAVKFITDKNPAYGTQGDRHHFLLDKVGLSETEYLDCLNKAVQ